MALFLIWQGLHLHRFHLQLKRAQRSARNSQHLSERLPSQRDQSLHNSWLELTNLQLLQSIRAKESQAQLLMHCLEQKLNSLGNTLLLLKRGSKTLKLIAMSGVIRLKVLHQISWAHWRTWNHPYTQWSVIKKKECRIWKTNLMAVYAQ